MLTLGDVVFGLGLPALVGIALFLLGRRPVAADAAATNLFASDARSALPLLLGFGFVVGYPAIYQGLPQLPPVEAHQWLFLAVLAMIVLSVIQQFVWQSTWFYYGASLVVIGFAIGQIIWLIARNDWSTVETVGAIAGGSIAAGMLLIAIGTICKSDSGRSIIVTLAALSAVSAAVLSMSGIKTNGQLAATLPASLAPAVLLAILLRTKLVSADCIPIFVLLYCGPLFIGYLYAEPGLGLLNGLLLFFAPLGLCVGLLPSLRAWKNWQRGLAQFGASMVPAAIAFGLALRKFLIDTAVELPY